MEGTSHPSNGGKIIPGQGQVETCPYEPEYSITVPNLVSYSETQSILNGL